MTLDTLSSNQKPSTKNPASSKLSLIHQLSMNLMGLKKVDEFYRETVRLIQNRFDFYHVSMWSVSASKMATLMAQAGSPEFSSRLKIGTHLSTEQGIIGQVMITEKPVLSNDVSEDPNFTSLDFKTETQSEVCVPVFSPDGKLLSTINIESNQLNEFIQDDVAMLETIARQVGLSLSNAQLFTQITQFNEKLVQTVEDKTKELKKAHTQILEQQKFLKKENRTLKTLVEKSKKPETVIVGQSPALQSIISMVDKIAPSHATVLIQGESGTGKELIAQRLHEKSDRKEKTYVTINCGTLQENLLESELFGHEKGAFTGAFSQKIGLAELADGGTLFLDEIGELSLNIQAKLLRFLQEGEFYRVGGKKPLKVNVRVISATNRDLEKEVREGRFREDLFYRLNTITLRMPPLRKRTEDISLLVDFFLNDGIPGGKHHKLFDPNALKAMRGYDWPGNIRELQNTVERIKILSDSHVIALEDIPFNIRHPQYRTDLFEFHQEMPLHELEKRHILKTLAYHKNNKTRAAHALGITIKTLYNKLHSYGMMGDKAPLGGKGPSNAGQSA